MIRSSLCTALLIANVSACASARSSAETPQPAPSTAIAKDASPSTTPPANAEHSAAAPPQTLSAGIAPSTASQFMSSIPLNATREAIEAARRALGDGDRTSSDLGIELSVVLPEHAQFRAIAERLPRARVEASRLRLPFELPTPKPKSADVARWSAPSFVIDYDAPGFRPFTQSFEANAATRCLTPSSCNAHTTGDLSATERFVSEYINKKTFSRGFAIASEVAASRTGDCTEHAVLLAAALRQQRVPARVVFGIVLVFGEAAAAFGHAWVEAVQNGSLVRLDAALLGVQQKEGVLLQYLPLDTLVDEGIGFSRTLREQPSTIHIRDVTVVLAGRSP